jgi:hypothetical protein
MHFEKSKFRMAPKIKKNQFMLTSFNNLPQQIDLLIEEIMFIKNFFESIAPPCPIETKTLDFESAKVLIRERGIPISNSRLYKLVSSNTSSLPFHKVGKRLLFFRNELEIWCQEQITSPVKINSQSINSVVKSAQKSINSLKIKSNG